MSDTIIERIGSVYLEDMAIIALTGSMSAPVQHHPDLDDERRARLRSRIKQVSRHDWPANRSEDPLIRSGYTLRQCCRLIVALMLIDAHLAPSHAIALAKANEPALLRLMVGRMAAQEPVSRNAAEHDRVAVVLLGELAELVAEVPWRNVESSRIRVVERSKLAELWSANDLSSVGQRLSFDLGTAAIAAWRWMLERRLMTGAALDQLARQLDQEDRPEYLPVSGTIRRR